MKRHTKVVLALFLIIFTLQLSPCRVAGIAEIKNNIILLIDNSSSMVNTDPYRLSIVAASILIDTLDDNTNANIISFGEGVMSVRKLKDKPTYEDLKSMPDRLQFNENGTNLKEGLKEALGQFSEVSGSRTLIILSDGREDPREGLTEAHKAEFNSLIEKSYSMRVKIHTIGLSDLADAETLSKVSFETGGNFFSCSSPSELFDIFSKVTGNIDNFYTIANYTTDNPGEKVIKFSPYIDEVLIKLASCDNQRPYVEVKKDNEVLPPDKQGDRYKIYKVKSEKNSTVKITAADKGKNSVIVQIKSTGKLQVSPEQDSLQVPANVPVEISSILTIDKDIPGLYMARSEGGREEEEKIGESGHGSYKFTFKKEQKGRYPIFIKAYDGNANLVAVKSIDVNVTDYPPFFYDNTLPEAIITEEPLKIAIKQLDNTKVEAQSGEIRVVDIEGRTYRRFTLKFDGSALTGEISVDKCGGYRIATYINGIYNKKSFSYSLPYSKLEVKQRPYLIIEAVNKKDVLKEGAASELVLGIKENVTYKNEKVAILDGAGNLIGEFETTPGLKGMINARIRPADNTEKLVLALKGEGNLKVTEKVETGMAVLSPVKYYLNRYALPLMKVVLVIIIILLAASGIGLYFYKTKVKDYRFNGLIFYKYNNSTNKSFSLYLDMDKNDIYMNIDQYRLYLSDSSRGAVGRFELKIHAPAWTLNSNMASKIILGFVFLLNIIKKLDMFEINYYPLMNQVITLRGKLIFSPVEYSAQIKSELTYSNKKVSIEFS